MKSNDRANTFEDLSVACSDKTGSANGVERKKDENLHRNHRSRMVERFLKSPDSLNDHEVLEILLYSVVKRKDTNPLAHKILSYFKDLNAVFEADAETLMKIDGVGERIAAELVAIGLVIKRCEKIKRGESGRQFRSLSNVLPLIEEAFRGVTTERFVLFAFDERKKFKTKITFDSDAYSSVAFDAQKLADAITVIKPKSAIIAHNHPTGITEPSNADDLATTKIEMIFALHGVTLLDHIIVADGCEPYSYFAQGRLQNIKNNCNIDRLIERSINTEE